MDIAKRLTLLHRIYALYDEFIAGHEAACRQGCASCCTRNVTMTTLEGYGILGQVPQTDQHSLMVRLRQSAGKMRFQPAVTINRMAAMCMAGEDLPDETADPSWGRCPMLTDEETCPFYGIRPFGCRSMISSRYCDGTGAAQMDPLAVTVSTVIQQTIEHIDHMGCTGNFTDILLGLEAGTRRRRYEAGRLMCQDLSLLPNRPLKVLMVPPEHREPIRPILEALNRIGSPV